MPVVTAVIDDPTAREGKAEEEDAPRPWQPHIHLRQRLPRPSAQRECLEGLDILKATMP